MRNFRRLILLSYSKRKLMTIVLSTYFLITKIIESAILLLLINVQKSNKMFKVFEMLRWNDKVINPLCEALTHHIIFYI